LPKVWAGGSPSLLHFFSNYHSPSKLGSMTLRRLPASSFSFAIAVPLLLFVFIVKIKIEPLAQRWLAKSPAIDGEQALVFAKGVKQYSLGFDNWTAGLVWIRLLQVASHEPVPDGKLSWEYAQLLAVTSLDRKFEQAYEFGSSFLSVFRRDTLGAKDLLERWTLQRPRWWRPHYVLGYHLYSELGRFDAAAAHILKAAELPNAPTWLTSLGVRLLSESGAFRHSLTVAIQLYPAVRGEEGRARLRDRIRALRYHILREEWQSRLAEFRKQFRRAPTHFTELATAFPSEQRSPASYAEAGATIDDEIDGLLAEPIRFRYDSLSDRIKHANPKLEKEWESVGVIRPKS